jgi:hypothetical protein
VLLAKSSELYMWKKQGKQNYKATLSLQASANDGARTTVTWVIVHVVIHSH